MANATVRRCRVCGCTDTQACAGGCWWVGRDLCSACQLAPPARVERPILFSGPMVRAILEGRKTQTRRPITRLHGFGQVHDFQRAHTPGYDWAFRDRGGRWNEVDDTRLRQQFCPFGVAGDRLWVRECFAAWWTTATGKRSHVMGYRADINDPDWDGFGAEDPWWLDAKWEPSIHMPRTFSRITLEITGVSVQRLQDISEEDAVAEGIDGAACAELSTSSPWRDVLAPSAVHAFASLWDSINGAGAWLANPWVWVVTFKRVEAANG